MDEMDTFPLVPLGCWLFPIGIYLLIIAFRFGMDKQNRRFVIVRCGWIQKWWKHFFLRNLLNGVFAAVGLLALFKMIDLFALQMFTGNLKEISAIFILWTVHAMTLSALFLLMEILRIKKLIPAGLLLLEGLTFLNGFRFRKSARFMFGVWGMYVQSNLYEDMYGFSMISVMIAQVIIIMVCYRFGSYLLKGKEMEGV
ncbi:MAG: hypothetical protein HFI48_10435 [Lachnospiraceae bacterium]|nr:hypothetical protein [Lachnospiraceae bacterium]